VKVWKLTSHTLPIRDWFPIFRLYFGLGRYTDLALEWMKTFTAKPTDIKHDWHLVDAAGVPLGRLASVVAQLIRGKHKPTFTPHMDGGDFVVVVNAAKVRLTGRKLTNKVYFGHTGYMGHERFTEARALLAKHPDRVIEKAVYGMLPKTSLAKQKLRGKLKVYAGPEHPHAAQQPKPFSVTPAKASA
jgi:large subunit ribosomal protein L13